MPAGGWLHRALLFHASDDRHNPRTAANNSSEGKLSELGTQLRCIRHRPQSYGIIGAQEICERLIGGFSHRWIQASLSRPDELRQQSCLNTQADSTNPLCLRYHWGLVANLRTLSGLYQEPGINTLPRTQTTPSWLTKASTRGGTFFLSYHANLLHRQFGFGPPTRFQFDHGLEKCKANHANQLQWFL